MNDNHRIVRNLIHTSHMTNDASNSVRAFYIDQPITDRSQDLLNRSEFAHGLARAIGGWTGSDSLVIALYGGWGSGKSSVKNIALQSLKESSLNEELRVLEFNPWQFGNRDQLTEAFFRAVTAKIGTEFPSQEERKRVVANLKAYAAALKVGVSAVAPVRAVFGAAALIAFIEATVNAKYPGTSSIVGYALTVAFAVLAAAPKILDGIAAWIEKRSEGKVRPLAELKKQITADMRKFRARLLVVLDDVDRLTPAETYELIQLVKANADFPNVVYLLLCQRDVVENALEKAATVKGRDFLEKIVQVGFNIPAARQDDLDTILFSKLDRILAAVDALPDFEQGRWQTVFLRGLRAYFYSLRNIYRFLSTLSFHAGLFTNRGKLDVNAVDLLALETLRVFEPDVYLELGRHKGVLTGAFEPSLIEDREDRLKEVLERVPEGRRRRLRQLIEELFPLSRQGATYSEPAATAWRASQRACSSDHFDRYFQLALKSHELRRSDEDELVAAAPRTPRFAEKLAELRSRGLLSAAVRQLEARKDEMPVQNASDLIRILCDLGDDFPQTSFLTLEVGADSRAVEIIADLVRRSRTAQPLDEALATTNGLYVPVALASELQSQSDRWQGVRNLITEDDIRRWRELCLGRLREASPEEKLRDHPHLGFLLGRWREWTDPSDPTSPSLRQVAARIAATPSGALNLVRALSARQVATGGPDEYGTVRYVVKFDELAKLVHPDTLESVLVDLDRKMLTEEDSRLFDGFQAGLHEWRRRSI